MPTTRFLCSLLVLLLLGLAGGAGQEALAQDQKDNIAMHFDVKVKPGMNAAFEAALKQHMAWRQQHSDPWTWQVYQVTVGDRLGEYGLRSTGHTWADLDAYQAWGLAARDHFYANVMPYIETLTNQIAMVDPDVVRWPEDMSRYQLFAVETFHLKPGQDLAFAQMVKKIHTAIGEHDYPIHYAMIWNRVGGEANTVTFVEPHENWASMQGPEKDWGTFMVEAFGEEEAMKLHGAFSETWESMDLMVVRLRADLMAPTTMAAGSE